MDLKDYFNAKKGVGILATADSDGKVDAAVYATPHFMDDGSLAFIMRDRLTHHNLTSNPSAVFLFIEKDAGYSGKRLFLEKIGEEENSELLKRLSRRPYPEGEDPKKGIRFLVFFKVVRTLPLIGPGESEP